MNQRPSKVDPILRALQSCERPLRAWLELSPANALLLLRDPIAALRAAGLGLDEEILDELDALMGGIQKKIEELG